MPIDFIETSDDPRLEDFRAIKERDLHGRDGVFIGEQPLIVERMLSMPEVVRRVLVIDRRLAWLEEAVAAHGAAAVECLVAPSEIVSAVAGFDLHRGVLASGNRAPFDARTLDSVLPHADRPATILCLESISNIDNIGALFRIAAAFGVAAVLLDETCHDPLYRKSLRVSIGHALSIPFVRSKNWLGDLAALKEAHGFAIHGASTNAHALNHRAADHAARTALILGSEFDGLHESTEALCDALLRIPMAAGVDSLNVAVAGAILLEGLSSDRITP